MKEVMTCHEERLAQTYNVLVDDCETKNDDFEHEKNDDEDSILKVKRAKEDFISSTSCRKLN